MAVVLRMKVARSARWKPWTRQTVVGSRDAALRHQLIVLRRKVHGRVQLSNVDRLFFVELYRRFPSILKLITVVRPETLVRWHREGFRPLLHPIHRVGRIVSHAVVGGLHHQYREIVRIAVTRHPTSEWLARQITEAFPFPCNVALRYLIRDRDRIYGGVTLMSA
jgi:hypothetical protein